MAQLSLASMKGFNDLRVMWISGYLCMIRRDAQKSVNCVFHPKQIKHKCPAHKWHQIFYPIRVASNKVSSFKFHHRKYLCISSPTFATRSGRSFPSNEYRQPFSCNKAAFFPHIESSDALDQGQVNLNPTMAL